MRLNVKLLVFISLFSVVSMIAVSAYPMFRGVRAEKEGVIFTDDFENSEKGKLLGWTADSKSRLSLKLTWDDIMSHSPSRSIKIESFSAHGEGGWRCEYAILVKPGAAYSLSYWARSEDIILGDSGAFVQINFYSREAKQIGLHTGKYPRITGDWNRYETIFTPPQGTYRIQLSFLIKDSSGKAWLDDVAVKNIQ